MVKFIGIGPELCKQHDVIQISEKFFFPNVEEFIASEVFASLRDEVILLKAPVSLASTSSPNCWYRRYMRLRWR